MNRKRRQYIRSCEISEMRTFDLGGYPQKVLIEGRKKSLPVVVCLHGGPGSPIPFSAGCRGLFPALTDRAVMVYWDQLGCGINNYKIDDGFTVGDFVKMTVELVREIKRLFPENRLYLFGISWGSVLSVKAANEQPDLVAGVLACGQVVKNLFFSDEVFDALAESDAPEKTKKKLEKLAEGGISSENKVLRRDMKFLTSCIKKYTDGYFNRLGEKADAGDIVKGLLTSPDYRLKDFIAVVKNGYAGNNSLWRELLKIDLTEELAGVSVPYYILQGDTDIVASTKTVLKIAENCGNENLHCTIAKNTGHITSAEGMEKLFGLLLKMMGSAEE